MSVDTTQAMKFFEACEAGLGWEGCKEFCTEDATFSAQAEPLAEFTSLREYADWMKWLYGPIPDAGYELKSFAVDEERGNVTAFAVFSGTHTGEGGPVPPTGKALKADYVYAMELRDGKVCHLTKIWHSWISLQQLGWS